MNFNLDQMLKMNIDSILYKNNIYSNYLEKYYDNEIEKNFLVPQKKNIFKDPLEYADKFLPIDISWLNTYKSLNLHNGKDSIQDTLNKKDLYWYYNIAKVGDRQNSKLMQKVYDSIHFTNGGDDIGYFVTYNSKVTKNISIKLLDDKNHYRLSPIKYLNDGGNHKNSFVKFLLIAENGYKFKHKKIKWRIWINR